MRGIIPIIVAELPLDSCANDAHSCPMTQTQRDAIISLFSKAENAATEEREFWDEQTITEDHRPPSWLEDLEKAIRWAGIELGIRWSRGKGWVTCSIPVDGPV